MHHVRVIKETVGDEIKIKVAGGCVTWPLVTIHAMGVHRFGIGMAATAAIIEEAGKYPDGIELKIMKTERYKC